MEEPRVYIVHLRQPNRTDKTEKRSDPFWEFGSFGCTGCHDDNLLNPKNAPKLGGARLAFVQDGTKGFRLILLTPPVKPIFVNGGCLEVTWNRNELPFKYAEAPLLVSNDLEAAHSAILQDLVSNSSRTPEGAFSSHFRSRCKPLDEEIAAELIKANDMVRNAPDASSKLTKNYVETLPFLPNAPDKNREATYKEKLEHRRQQLMKGNKIPCKPSAQGCEEDKDSCG